MALDVKFRIRLKEIREEKGMSQSELAEKAGVSQQAISRIENLSTNVTLVTCYRLATILDCSMWDIAELEAKEA